MAKKPIDCTFLQIRRAYYTHFKKPARGLTATQAKEQLIVSMGYDEARRLIERTSNDSEVFLPV